ncbi:MAG TPA: M1 family metallopeptidase [Thermoplasmata archaeon]|nr:M1 family metallopeptidase [Thermoplasmata archaeon]
MSSPPRPEIAEYRLSLDVDFERGRWRGRVEFDAPVPTQPVELNAEGLEVEAVRQGTDPLPFTYLPSEGRLLLAEPPGHGPVSVDFTGEVKVGALIGMYRCRHADGTVLTTQCEPVGARRIFPCQDEPARKARLRLTVRTRADLEVISNTSPEVVRTLDGDRVWSFVPTPPMSTYLFYLGIGRFDRVEDLGGRVAVRVLGPPGRGPAGEFAVHAGRRILEAYEEYFRIPYPLPKLDLVAVADQAFGAMENWGAICFRDMRLLVDATADSYTRQDVFETAGHEIAHQWFGNLVTMATWDDVWLNESFASLMETRITQRLEPDMDSTTDFYLRVAGTAAAIDADSLASTHPVRAHVDRPEEISQIFDEISYGKGCSILAMLETYLGPERFRAGVVDYLERFRYANARTEDLWEALGRAGNQPVATMAAPWVDRPGHPVIHARHEGATLRLTQERFSLLPSGNDDPPWPIPLVMDVDAERRRLIFSERTVTLPVPTDAVVHLNPGAVGFYRVHYDPELLERLFHALPSRAATDRWKVADDLGSFLFSGTVEWRTFAEFVRRVGGCNDLLVVTSLAGTLTTLERILPTASAVHDETRRYLAERMDAVGVRARPGEKPATGTLRDRVAGYRVRADQAFARDLSDLFPEWSRLDPDLRAAVAVARARSEGRTGWNELRRARERASTEAETFLLDRALPWTPEPELLEATLDMTLSGEIATGHAVHVLAQAVISPAARDVVWPWLTRHLDQLAERFSGSTSLSTLLERTTIYVGLGRAEEVRAFYRTHPFPEGSRGLAKGLERLEVAERLRSRAASFRSD